MAARIYYKDPDTGLDVEISDRIDRVGWEVRENAEEGSTALSSIVIDDPDMDLDIDGHRRFLILEDTSEATDNVLFQGYTADQSIARQGGNTLWPLGRAWTVSVADVNSIWQRRVMVGADCKRPAESDVERMQWLITTAEAGIITDDTTYVSTASPVDMDAVDYRGQSMSQVADDCAQASGKNWFVWARETGTGRVVSIWYGRDGLATYSSDLFLSNDPLDWTDDDLGDGTSLVWPISMDTKLNRDPSRVYSGVYLTYDRGAVYRQDAATAAAFAKRDFVAPTLNVKSETKAIARAVRYLNELDTQDERITTSVELPAAKATMIRAGMRVRFRATHLPGFDVDWQYEWCRVLSCAVSPIAAGDRYRLTLELSPTGAHYVPAFTGDAYAVLMRAEHFPSLGWMGTGDDLPLGWWPNAQTRGPLEIQEAGSPYRSIMVLADMVVRIYAVVHWSGVVEGRTIDVAVTVDGEIVGSDSQSTGGGLHYWDPVFVIDVRDYAITAGAVIDVTGSSSGEGGWTNFGTNGTFLQVGRGTIALGDSGVFVGP